MTQWHRESFSFLSTGLKNGEDGYNLVCHELPYMNIGTAYESGGVKVTHFPAVHSRNGSISYKLEWNGLKMVFSGDTRPNEYMIEQARGADVLIHEMVLPPEIWGSKNTGKEKGEKGFEEAVSVWKDIQDSSHTLPKALGYILNKTRPRLGVATHFQDNPDTIGPVLDDVRKLYDGPFVISGDLMVLNISKKAIRHRTALVSNYAWPANLQTYEGQLAPPKYKGPLDQISEKLRRKMIPEKKYQ
jgi:ribonuclease Z